MKGANQSQNNTVTCLNGCSCYIKAQSTVSVARSENAVTLWSRTVLEQKQQAGLFWEPAGSGIFLSLLSLCLIFISRLPARTLSTTWKCGKGCPAVMCFSRGSWEVTPFRKSFCGWRKLHEDALKGHTVFIARVAAHRAEKGYEDNAALPRTNYTAWITVSPQCWFILNGNQRATNPSACKETNNELEKRQPSIRRIWWMSTPGHSSLPSPVQLPQCTSSKRTYLLSEGLPNLYRFTV